MVRNSCPTIKSELIRKYGRSDGLNDFLDMVKDTEKSQLGLDFDGVIHKNSKGFHDGTIYDEPLEGYH